MPMGAAHDQWRDISYLKCGNDRQRAAFRTLQQLEIIEVLRPYGVILAGTIPLEIDIPGSDLDLLCQPDDMDMFAELVRCRYGDHSAFRSKQQLWDTIPTVVAGFETETFPIEIFAQTLPIIEQRAYRHMIVEARLLEIGGPAARQAIRQLKLDGRKTEPAFAAYFRIPGDPYEQLFQLYDWDDRRLREAVDSRIWIIESV
ncbi:MAG: DUF4269 domain-containing protein [Phycisphaerales bacterium]|nr:DUF4269 domain-containing protein [Phycisphaerales bacterium]